MKTVDDAIELATRLHKDQIDKAGQPYIEHPLRVMNILKEKGHPDWVLQAGVTHDLLEDAAITSNDLSLLGYHPDVVAAVIAMTRWPDQKPYQYYANINSNYIWREIKLADIQDNTDPVRLGVLPVGLRNRLVTKYKNALEDLHSEWLHPRPPL